LQDDEGTDAQLRTMFERFPQNEEVQQALVRWMLHRGDLEGAEDLLRELAGDDASPPEGHLVVVQFLQETKGLEAAQAELGRLAQANPESSNGDLYAALSAGIDFEMGKRDQAIEAVEAILADAEPSDVTRRIKTALARMLAMTGDAVGARARVEEVLAEDASHVEALKLRATWAIQQDRPGDAIMDLRNALSQQPEDVEAQTLLAEAHLRDGSPELAGERLAAAVQASGSAKAPSMRYASFLISQGNEVAARTVLEDARQANPGDVELAVRLAELWLEAGEDARAEGIVAELEALGTSESQEAAGRLDAAILLAGAETTSP
jgi:thioredoxin-like negative regulator of GroEL